MLTKYWRLQQQQIPALKAVRESCDIAGTLKEYKDVSKMKLSMHTKKTKYTLGISVLPLVAQNH